MKITLTLITALGFLASAYWMLLLQVAVAQLLLLKVDSLASCVSAHDCLCNIDWIHASATEELKIPIYCFKMGRNDWVCNNIVDSSLFRLSSPHLAEELNTVVGTAFRVAYAAQIQSQSRQKVNVSQQLSSIENFLIEPTNFLNPAKWIF